MFGNLGQMAGLMMNLPRLQEAARRMQEQLDQLVVEGDAGAGMVRVRINGRMVVQSCTISPEALADREMLEDLIKAATTQALEKVRKAVAEETSRMMAGLGLPGGINLPGLG